MAGEWQKDQVVMLAVTVAASVVAAAAAAHYAYHRHRQVVSRRPIICNMQSLDADGQIYVAMSSNVLRCYAVTDDDAVDFDTLGEVSAAIRDAGLLECKLIIGIDFTASNAIQGERTFGGKGLHCLDASVENPYQQVIRIIGHTLAPFDETGIIRGFGFGDLVTKDTSVFELDPKRHFCHGFKELLEAYNKTVERVTLSGPTNFAPIIYRAIEIVRREKKYHILVIIADGQVVDEVRTRNAIVAASMWPLSIIMVGVGDGPWSMMEAFDARLPARKFDNFNFVDFNEVVVGKDDPDYEFALHALMEIPTQYIAIKNSRLLKVYDNSDYDNREKQVYIKETR